MINLLNKLFGKRSKPEIETKVESAPSYPCCSEKVHIGYRGVSDDRLYLSYDRKWGDVKFFRPNGLRVFCALCRNRIL
jgi:hypothetical protein